METLNEEQQQGFSTYDSAEVQVQDEPVQEKEPEEPTGYGNDENLYDNQEQLYDNVDDDTLAAQPAQVLIQSGPVALSKCTVTLSSGV